MSIYEKSVLGRPVFGLEGPGMVRAARRCGQGASIFDCRLRIVDLGKREIKLLGKLILGRRLGNVPSVLGLLKIDSHSIFSISTAESLLQELGALVPVGSAPELSHERTEPRLSCRAGRVGTMNLDEVFAESLSCDPVHAQFSFPRFIDQYRIR